MEKENERDREREGERERGFILWFVLSLLLLLLPRRDVLGGTRERRGNARYRAMVCMLQTMSVRAVISEISPDGGEN